MNCYRCDKPLPKGKVKCVSCGAWNAVDRSRLLDSGGDGTVLLSNVSESKSKRFQTGPWDKNFAEPPGVPDDALILIAGAPGVGKTTMAIQFCDALSTSQKRESLYVPAEGSDTLILSYAKRIQVSNLPLIRLIERNRLSGITIEEIVLKYKPCGVIVDSLPGFTDDPREAVQICKSLNNLTKEHRTPFIIIEHITKDGDMAGFKSLEHEVDIVCMVTKTPKDEVIEVYFADDPEQEIFEIEEMREIDTRKSRYGPAGAQVRTFYAMTNVGLKQVMLAEEDEDGDEDDE